MKCFTSHFSHKGFSFVEMVVTVIVLAILTSISMPAIYQYLSQRDKMDEEVRLNEIKKAFQAYLADKGSLPDDSTAVSVPADQLWYNLLGGYTNLPTKDIMKDIWGRDRRYIRTQATQRIYGTDLKVDYITVHSAGVNGRAENTYVDGTGAVKTIPGLAVTANAFDTETNTNWWDGGSTPSANATLTFSSLRPGGDDHIMRYTNYTEVMDNYKTTMERMDKISQSLEIFARNAYARRIAMCDPAAVPNLSAEDFCGKTGTASNNIPETTVYYPCSEPKSTTTECVNTAANNNYRVYDFTLSGTTKTITRVVRNGGSDTERYDDMVKLMQILGLPAEYCCSALEMFTVAGVKKPRPFYYFSNPRPRSTSGCATSTNPGVGATKLPARITTDNNGDSSSNPTCG